MADLWGRAGLKPPQNRRSVFPHPLPSLCGFGLMLGRKIKAKEIKRLPLTGKANSASLLLEPWRGRGQSVTGVQLGGGSNGAISTTRAPSFLLRTLPPGKLKPGPLAHLSEPLIPSYKGHGGLSWILSTNIDFSGSSNYDPQTRGPHIRNINFRPLPRPIKAETWGMEWGEQSMF